MKTKTLTIFRFDRISDIYCLHKGLFLPQYCQELFKYEREELMHSIHSQQQQQQHQQQQYWKNNANNYYYIAFTVSEVLLMEYIVQSVKRDRSHAEQYF
uniref:Uncharacterized protein n=1 Tax=Glossina palpalis gambiensis TaxID=67801 RepID=A0A1B0B5A8_9MUSC